MHPLPSIRLGLIGAVLLAGIGCSSSPRTSRVAPNDPSHAGRSHPYVQDTAAIEWPVHAAAGQPRGLLFRAAVPARATLLCLHGIQTHAAWFAPLARELAQQGINVIAMDRRGSGMNSGPPFTPGDAPGARVLLDDLDQQVRAAAALGPPVYLAGTSWGSNVASVHVLRGQGTQPAGLIQIVPATRSFSEASFSARCLLPIVGVLFPAARRRLPFTDAHYQAGHTQPDAITGLPPWPRRTDHSKASVQEESRRLTSLLSQDTKYHALVQEPTCRLLLAGLELGREWRGGGTGRNLAVPMLLIVADRDQIMDNHQAHLAARKHTGAWPGQLTFRHLPSAGHGAQITHAAALAGHITRWISHESGRPRPES